MSTTLRISNTTRQRASALAASAGSTIGELVAREQGRRPSIVISSDEWNRYAATCIVVPLTRTLSRLPTRSELEPTRANGLSATSHARAEDVRSVSDDRLGRRLGAVDVVDLHAISATLRRLMEL